MALVHIDDVRNYFLLNDAIVSVPSQPDTYVVSIFKEFVRKIWNMHHFKSHVSPHEILQTVAVVSKKRFQFSEQGDPLELLVWLLNSLDSGLTFLTKKVLLFFFY